MHIRSQENMSPTAGAGNIVVDPWQAAQLVLCK